MLTFPPDCHEDLQTLAQINYDGLTQRGIDEQAAAEISLAMIDEVLQVFGGHTKYWPKGNHMTAKRDEEIFLAHKGGQEYTVRLANRYNLSERMIEIIVKRVTERRRRERQGVLAL